MKFQIYDLFSQWNLRQPQPDNETSINLYINGFKTKL